MARHNRRQTAKERRALQKLDQDAVAARKAFARADAWAQSKSGARYGATIETLSASAPQAPETPGSQAPKRLESQPEAVDA